MARRKRAPYHHGDLRRALLDATLELAEARGAAGVTLREAARVAGVSQTAPYRHFPDKTAMLAAASEEGFLLLKHALADATRPYPEDPRRRIVEAVVAYVDFAVAHGPYVRLMFGQGNPAKAVATTLQARARDAFQVAFVAVGECLAGGILRGADARATTFQLWALAHGIATLILDRQTAHLGVTAARAAGLARGACEALLDGFASS